MKRLKIVLHEKAIEDLEETWLYTYQTGHLNKRIGTIV